MKRFFAIMTAALSVFGGTDVSATELIDSKDTKILVAFFSRTGENYGVGNITKGNTHIVAEMIAGKTGGTLFRIEPVKPYPEDYDDCTDVAQEELQTKARPAIKTDCAAEEYDIIFLGYPNWWGHAPMPVYTWVEKHNLKGKTIIPFCTHEGSGLGIIAKDLHKSATGATFRNGFAIKGTKAQRDAVGTKKAVDEWLANMGF